MFALALLVGSIALADSLNPSTVLPALYLSTTPNAVRKVASFTLGVAAPSLLFGVVFVAGPGQLILRAAPHLSENGKHYVEIGVGAFLILLAVVLWRGGQRLSDRIPTGETASRGGPFAVGAAIMALELPTALPYFAALAAIIGSDAHLSIQIGYVVLFNFLFVLPLIAILVLRARATEGAARRIDALGEWIRTYAAAVIAVIAGVAGAGFMILGLVDLR
ncbi:MAG: GAP family protein [Thermoleophilaceae bacterium]